MLGNRQMAAEMGKPEEQKKIRIKKKYLAK